MRFMFIVKSAHSGPPTPELLEAMHKLADREIKAGRMLDNAGLTPLATGAQLRIKDGLPASSTARSSRRKRSSAATLSSSCRAKKRPWRLRRSSCNSTRTSSRAGKARASCVRLPALEAMVRRTLSAAMTVAETHRAILAVWRVEQPRLITSLARMMRDVPLAEDLTQEALLAAPERRPATGVPEGPGAWLMATAKRRALDHLRRGPMLERTHETIARDMVGGATGHARLGLRTGRRHRR